MAIEVAEVATATMVTVAPFLPYLSEFGRAGGRKLAEVVAEKGGEAAWNKAQAVWGKITAHFGDDPEVTGAAQMLAAKPKNGGYQTVFAEVLGSRLAENPDLAKELLRLLGGREGVQRVTAGHHSVVEDVSQRMKGGGTQIVEAGDDSHISGVEQVQE